MVHYIWYISLIEMLLFSIRYEEYRTDLSKHVFINTQIDHNGLFKNSNYTVLFINVLSETKNIILCCCLATKNVQSNMVNVIVVFDFMSQLCIRSTSPATNITFQRNILHL